MRAVFLAAMCVQAEGMVHQLKPLGFGDALLA
jgi:hypothetical protein